MNGQNFIQKYLFSKKSLAFTFYKKYNHPVYRYQILQHKHRSGQKSICSKFVYCKRKEKKP